MFQQPHRVSDAHFRQVFERCLTRPLPKITAQCRRIPACRRCERGQRNPLAEMGRQITFDGIHGRSGTPRSPAYTFGRRNQPVIRTACQPSENLIQTHQPLRTRQRLDRADQAADLGRQHPVAETNPPATALQQSADFGIIPQTLHILREQVGRKLQNLARTRFAVPSQAHPVAQMEMRQPAA